MSVCIFSRVFPRAKRLAGTAILIIAVIMLGTNASANLHGQEVAESDVAPAEDVTLDIDDGLELHMTYYPGPADKETVPILIVHDWEKEARSDYKALAEYLQSKGHSVVVPDLRGHGDSTTRNRQDGTPEKLNPRNFDNSDYVAVVTKDLEAVREFLLEKHKNEELNLNKLFVVGAGDGALFGLYWAITDWLRDQDWVGTHWNGQSVRGLVLISPSTEFKTLDLESRYIKANKKFLPRFSVLIIVGDQERLANVQANKYRTTLKQFNPPPPKDKPELTTFFYKPMDTLLQGARLVAQPEFDIDALVNGFVKLRSEKMPAYKPWDPP